MDWELAEKTLHELERHFKKNRYRYSIVRALIISPLRKRFESGERTKDLYDDIMLIK